MPGVAQFDGDGYRVQGGVGQAELGAVVVAVLAYLGGDGAGLVEVGVCLGAVVLAGRVIPVHATRKTCASLLVALDVHPRVAMGIPGPVATAGAAVAGVGEAGGLAWWLFGGLALAA